MAKGDSVTPATTLKRDSIAFLPIALSVPPLLPVASAYGKQCLLRFAQKIDKDEVGFWIKATLSGIIDNSQISFALRTLVWKHALDLPQLVPDFAVVAPHAKCEFLFLLLCHHAPQLKKRLIFTFFLLTP